MNRIYIFVFLLIVCSGMCAAAETKPPFFALCMDTHDEKHRTIDQQNELLKELGYDGVAQLWLDGLEERAASAKKHGLELYQVYFEINLASDPPFDKRLAEVLPCVKGGKTQLALLINGGKPSDATRDDQVVQIVRNIREIADPLGVKVVLYPHVQSWNEKVDDCVRIAKRFPDGRVGVMFNLCHWAKIDRSENLDKVLQTAKPYLDAVSLNGTDTPEEIQAGTGHWLQPLDAGSYDISILLKALEKIDYHGPIGLQCYGQTGDARLHLERSIKKWREMRNEK